MGFISAIKKYKEILLYGASLALLLLLLQWLEFRFLVLNNASDIYIGIIALVFTGLGIWLAVKVMEPKRQTIIVEKEVPVPQNDFTFNEAEKHRLGLSKRELEVLDLMGKGMSNAEIADSLCVSLNTIKTHNSKIFEKLEVKRRTQAVDAAKRLMLLP